MLKMLKYEFRRGIFPLLIVGIVIAAIELYFLISTLTEHADHSVIAVSLLILAAFCCYLFVIDLRHNQLQPGSEKQIGISGLYGSYIQL